MTSNPKGSATSVVECPERYPEVDRRSGLSIREFNREYRSHRKPVVITDAIDDWKARSAGTFDFFKSKFARPTGPSSERIQNWPRITDSPGFF